MELLSGIQTLAEAKEQCRAEFRKHQDIVDTGESQTVVELEDEKLFSKFIINIETFTAEAGDIREQFWVEDSLQNL